MTTRASEAPMRANYASPSPRAGETHSCPGIVDPRCSDRSGIMCARTSAVLPRTSNDFAPASSDTGDCRAADHLALTLETGAVAKAMGREGRASDEVAAATSGLIKTPRPRRDDPEPTITRQFDDPSTDDGAKSVDEVTPRARGAIDPDFDWSDEGSTMARSPFGPPLPLQDPVTLTDPAGVPPPAQSDVTVVVNDPDTMPNEQRLDMSDRTSATLLRPDLRPASVPDPRLPPVSTPPGTPIVRNEAEPPTLVRPPAEWLSQSGATVITGIGAIQAGAMPWLESLPKVDSTPPPPPAKRTPLVMITAPEDNLTPIAPITALDDNPTRIAPITASEDNLTPIAPITAPEDNPTRIAPITASEDNVTRVTPPPTTAEDLARIAAFSTTGDNLTRVAPITSPGPFRPMGHSIDPIPYPHLPPAKRPAMQHIAIIAASVLLAVALLVVVVRARSSGSEAASRAPEPTPTPVFVADDTPPPPAAPMAAPLAATTPPAIASVSALPSSPPPASRPVAASHAGSPHAATGTVNGRKPGSRPIAKPAMPIRRD
jgi:hypothetical protein